MKLLNIFEIIAIICLAGLLLTPLAVMALVVLIIGFSAKYAKNKVKQPIKNLYLGIELGSIIGVFASALLLLFITVKNLDTFGLFGALPITSVTIILGGIVGVITGFKNKK